MVDEELDPRDRIPLAMTLSFEQALIEVWRQTSRTVTTQVL
jgi:hypothetical protein